MEERSSSATVEHSDFFASTSRLLFSATSKQIFFIISKSLLTDSCLSGLVDIKRSYLIFSLRTPQSAPMLFAKAGLTQLSRIKYIQKPYFINFSDLRKLSNANPQSNRLCEQNLMRLITLTIDNTLIFNTVCSERNSTGRLRRAKKCPHSKNGGIIFAE